MDNPLISVIVPCYNQAQYLHEALQSVLNQTYAHWECIIVNDGSPDNTEEVAKKWIEKDNRFIYLYKVNGGLSSARNAGIAIAKGKYILPLDADDKISPNYLETCNGELENDTELTLVYGKGIKFELVNGEWKLNDYSFENLLKGNMIFCTAMYRKTEWEKASGYDENMKAGFEDWEFWINILKENGKVIKNENCIFYYRIKDYSMIVSLANDKNKKKELIDYIFNKHRYLYTKKSNHDLYIESEKLDKVLAEPFKYFSFGTIIKILVKRVNLVINIYLKKISLKSIIKVLITISTLAFHNFKYK